MPCPGVVSDQAGKSNLIKCQEMPSTIQRMKSGVDQLLRVADVVKIRRSDERLPVIEIQLLR